VPSLAQILAPNEREYFNLFEQAGANIVRAAGLLDEMLASYPDHRELASVIHDCEHDGDRIAHDIIQRLNHTFVTPFDREDIHELVSVLDDIVDFIDEVADYLGVYKIDAPMEQSQQLAGVLAQAARQVAEALTHLRGFKNITHYTVEVHRLENEADRIVRDAIGSLFEGGIDPMVVIRWKDIYERLENAIDSTERAAYIIEGIVIKNA
jgi:predicted phosphate transport protein (TIGR00153 family)